MGTRVVDHDELAHHSRVLVRKQVAVEHVGSVRVGVVAVPRDQFELHVRRQKDGVLPAGQLGRRRPAVHGEHLELHVVNVEVVRHPIGVAHLPHLDAAGLHDRVDAVHVHPFAIDRSAAEPERADVGRLRRIEARHVG